jgi:uncharacterized protein (TIGR02270 family)
MANTGIIPEVYVVHLEEFAFLWQQRQTALHSADFYLRDVAALEMRIEAHVDGLLVPGEAAVPVLEEFVAADDPAIVFAAAYVMLRLQSQNAANKVAELFLKAVPENIGGFRVALCHGPIQLIEAALREAAESANPLVAAAATEILLFHQRFPGAADRVNEFLQHAEPEVRRTGWRIVALRS